MKRTDLGITSVGATVRDRKSDTLSPIFMGKLPSVPKEANLWGSRMARRRFGKLGSFRAKPFACQIDGGKHDVEHAATGATGATGTEHMTSFKCRASWLKVI